ncbi:MAG: hypothetical protein E7523_02590 [Ruminococcaceae bacterium]|nr:hypothetical protein [Oscillospiraceae bacterium]
MKIFKKVLFVIVSIVILSLCVSFVSAADGEVTDLGVIFEINNKQIRVAFRESNGKYYLFMPSDVPMTSLVLDFNAKEAVFLDGKQVQSGDFVSFEASGEYVISCNGNEKVLSVFASENVASVHITTKSGSMAAVHADKSHKEEADIVIIDDGAIVTDSALSYIKGRGNATWGYVKKPYNIKFDKKTSLFGMDKAKKWTLLANYYDKTMLRNATAFALAETAGLAFTSEYVFTDLYINDEYYGSYLLCESVEVGDGRVEIADLESETEDVNTDDLDSFSFGGAQVTDYTKLQAGTQKWVNIPNNPENITGGYLLEYELATRYPEEVSGFVTDRKQPIVLKAPEYASQAQVQYISSYYQEFEDAVFSADGYNAAGKHYTEYIDVDSFVKMYVFQEFVKNLDAGLTSFYICKDADSGLFRAAPVWDFDKALGSSEARYGTDIRYPTGWWAGVIYYQAQHAFDGAIPTILNALYKQDDFFELACRYWNDEFSQLITATYLNNIGQQANELLPSAVMNCVRWNYYATDAYDAVESAYMNETNATLIDFIANRKAFLDSGFSASTVRVFFDANGASGCMFNDKIFKNGDYITLPACTFTFRDKIFDGWSTSEDGSGGKWSAGERVQLNSEKETFYALWKEVEQNPALSDCDHICHSDSGFMRFIWTILSFFYRIFRTNQFCECGALHY